MGRHLVYTLATMVIVVAQLGYSSPSAAQSAAAIEAARRVNIVERQRMLSQRMSKASCFVAVGLEPDAARQELAAAADLFSRSLAALRNGDAEMGLVAEQREGPKNALSAVSSDWQRLSPLIDEVLAGGSIPRPEVARINELGLVLLEDIDKAVTETAQEYSEALPGMPLLLSITIDLAGRQQILTQMAAKQFCLVDAGLEPEANRENLANAEDLFTQTLQALISGMQGIVMAAPNDEILEKLLDVAVAWAGPKAVIDHAAAGEPITDAQRQVMLNDMERVLVLMNEAVGMYEQAIPEPE